MRVELRKQASNVDDSTETQPTGTPDPSAVEWLRNAMREGQSPQGDDATMAPVGAQTVQGGSGHAPTLGDRILTRIRGAASGISEGLDQSNTLAKNIKDRPSLESGSISDLIEFQKTNLDSYVKLDIFSKMVGKGVYTVDSLCRN